MGVHVQHTASKDPVAANLARQRLRICMLGLAQLKSIWPVAGWFLQAFRKVDGVDKQDDCVNMSKPQSKELSCSKSIYDRSQHAVDTQADDIYGALASDVANFVDDSGFVDNTNFDIWTILDQSFLLQ